MKKIRKKNPRIMKEFNKNLFILFIKLFNNGDLMVIKMK